MGSHTDAGIEAFQEVSGIKPATGRRAEILKELADTAFELIKITELERSGIRDGDGYWHGSDVMSAVSGNVAALVEEYHRTYEAELAEPDAPLPF